MSVAIFSFIATQMADAFGYKPYPFVLGMVLAGNGIAVSLLMRDTLAFVLPATVKQEGREMQQLSLKDGGQVVERQGGGSYLRTIWTRTRDTLCDKKQWSTLWHTVRYCFTTAQLLILILGGLVNNAKDGFLWGALPNFFSEDYSMTKSETAFLVMLYPAIWGLGQPLAGYVSDKWGMRKPLIVVGMGVQAVALLMLVIPQALSDSLAANFMFCSLAMIILGAGTAMIYPLLQAQCSDEVPTSARGTTLGIYRTVRDTGYAVGASVGGSLVSWLGITNTLIVLSAILALTTLVLAAGSYLFYRPSTNGHSRLQRKP